MRVDWMTFKGKKILYCDYHGLKDEAEIMPLIKRQMELIGQAHEPVLLMVNLADSVISPDTAKYSKEGLAAANAKLKKIALVGVTGLKSIIVKGISTSIGAAVQEMFATVEEAQAWLVM